MGREYFGIKRCIESPFVNSEKNILKTKFFFLLWKFKKEFAKIFESMIKRRESTFQQGAL